MKIIFSVVVALVVLSSGRAMAAPTINYSPLAMTAQTTDRVLSVSLTDALGVATGGLAPRIYFRKNASALFTRACTLVSGTVNNGGWNCSINNADLGGVAVTDVVSYFVVAQDTAGALASNPAGVVATNVNSVSSPPPSLSSYAIVAAVPSTVNVGPGEAITSLTNAGGLFALINSGVVTSNVNVNITGNLTSELGTHALNQWAEEGAGSYTLLIRPSGGARTISGSNSSALIRLNGADRVTLDGSTSGATANGIGGNAALRELTIQNTNTGTNSAVIALQSDIGGAQNNTLRNLNVLGQDPTTTLIGIALGGSTPGTAGTNNHFNRIENCSVRRARFGIYSAGSNVTLNLSTVITMNDLSATGADRIRRVGILVFADNGLQVTQNSVGGIDTNESADAIGIGLGIQEVNTSVATSASPVIEALVSTNRISGVLNQNTVGFSAAGIAVSGRDGGVIRIQNNMVSGVSSQATSPDLVAGIFIAGVPLSFTALSFNSVSMTGERGTVAAQSPSYAVAITGTNPLVELKNNVFHTTQTSGGGTNAKSYAIGTVSAFPNLSNLNSNHNAYFSNGANAGHFRSGSLGTGAGVDFATLAAWRGVVPGDANSIQIDPLFVSTSDLHLQPTTPLIGAGTPVPGITLDFDGQTRSITAPTIGADELVVAADLQISKANGVTIVAAGGNTTYTIVANNPGPSSVIGATVADTFPASLTCTWVCSGASGGTCTAAGTGNINNLVNLPVGASVTYTVTCAISPFATGTLSNTATVSSAVADPVSSNNSATDTDTITPLTYVITAAANPLAGGSVTCVPNPVNHGSNSTCTQTPNPGATFTGWSGACSGTGACVISGVVANQSVTANFAQTTYTITAAANPVGGGTLTCSPNPVTQGSNSNCSQTPNVGFTFTGWSGACTGMGACNLVNVTSNQTVTANYAVSTYTINATASPVAGGSVTCTPNPVPHGSNTTCTQTPNAGATFTGWTGACTGTGACIISGVTSNRNVTANYSVSTFTITANASPTAGGSVSCSPNPVASGGNSTCTQVPNVGATFTGWSGACSGTGACVLNNVTASLVVTANYVQSTYSVTASVVPSFGGGISCSPNPVGHGSSVTCTATPAIGFAVRNWTGSCGGTAGGAGNTNFLTNAVTSDCTVIVNVATNALNIDNSDPETAYDAATDGVLLVRYLLGYRDAALIVNARGSGANVRNAAAIETFIENRRAIYDVDGDGESLPHTDGLMILRRLLNPSAINVMTAAEQSAITANAKRGTLTDLQVLQRIEALKP